MWPFEKRTPDVIKGKLQGRKKITVMGTHFLIRRLNPLLDFQSDKIPQIFTDFQSRRPVDPKRVPTVEEIKKIQNDMKAVIEAGVLEPKLGKEPDLTVDDLFRDFQLGYRLYMEIISHSLGYFSGTRGVFFWIKTKWWLLIHWRDVTVSARQMSYFQKADSQ